MSEQLAINVENIKCGGCANSIRKNLLGVEQVEDVQVDTQAGRVDVRASSTDEQLRDELVARLLSMGYPEQGSVEGLKAVKARASSFVSCAIGRVSGEA